MSVIILRLLFFAWLHSRPIVYKPYILEVVSVIVLGPVVLDHLLTVEFLKLFVLHFISSVNRILHVVFISFDRLILARLYLMPPFWLPFIHFIRPFISFIHSRILNSDAAFKSTNEYGLVTLSKYDFIARNKHVSIKLFISVSSFLLIFSLMLI